MEDPIYYVQSKKQIYQKLHEKYQTALYFLRHNSNKNLDSNVLYQIYQKLNPFSSDLDMNIPDEYLVTQSFYKIKHSQPHTYQLRIARLDAVNNIDTHYLDFNNLRVNIIGDIRRVKNSVLFYGNDINSDARDIKDQISDYKTEKKWQYPLMLFGLVGIGSFFAIGGLLGAISMIIGLALLSGGLLFWHDYRHSDKLYGLKTHYAHVSIEDFAKIIKLVDNRVIKKINSYNKELQKRQKELLPAKHIKAIKNGKYSWNQSALAVKNKQNVKQDVKQPA